MSGLPPHLRARILEDARRAPAPTIAARRSGALLAAACGVGASLLFSAIVLGFRIIRPLPIFVALAVGGALSAFAATWLAASRGKSMLGRPAGVLTAVAVLAPLGLLALATTVTGFEGGVVLRGGTIGQHLVCTVCTLCLALGPFAALVYARRGTDPVHPRALGAALGAAAGAWGAGMIDLHCSLTTVEHLALGHAFPIVLVSALGAFLGAKVLGVRATPL
jgi:hypothetical protein